MTSHESDGALGWLRDKLSVEDFQKVASEHNNIIIRVRREGKAEAYELVGRRFSELLRISTPADHIRADDARERELAIYRGESEYWRGLARAIYREIERERV